MAIMSGTGIGDGLNILLVYATTGRLEGVQDMQDDEEVRVRFVDIPRCSDDGMQGVKTSLVPLALGDGGISFNPSRDHTNNPPFPCASPRNIRLPL